jgi:NACHT domain/HEAT repeats
MVVESLLVLGGSKLIEWVSKDVLDFTRETAKDYFKDVFKGKIGAQFEKFQPELRAAVSEAIGEFIKLFVKELRAHNINDEDIEKRYLPYIKKFIRNKDLKPLLGKAFESGFKRFEDNHISQIQQIWMPYQPPEVIFPEEFEWDLLLGNYRKQVKEIRRQDEKLCRILDSEVLEEIATAIKSIIEISPGFEVDRYRASLQCSYGSLKLHTLDTTDRQYQIKLWQMFIEQNVREDLPPSRFELPRHYQQQLLKSGQLDVDLNSEQLEQYRRLYLEKSAESVLKVLADKNCQHAVIVGDPGSGKSTLLQYLALDWVEGKTRRLPLLIELREYITDRAKSTNFLDFWHRGAGADWKFDRHQLHEYLQTQPSLVMFDGLDEIFDRQVYRDVVDEIANFATQQYPQSQIVVTSRVIGYNPERLRDAKFRHFTLQELDELQIDQFIDKWHDLALGIDPGKDRLKQQIKQAIKDSPAIQNLADNPLLLTMMVILNRRQPLPRDRAELYDQASRVLLHNWDVDHKKLNLPLDSIGRQEKQAMLRLIAYEMQSGEKGLKGNLIDDERLKDLLAGYLENKRFDNPGETAWLLIQQLRSRNFILCDRGADTYSFVHRTFLEYFCATEIVRRFERGKSLSFEQLRDDVFGQYWHDKTWHEVLRLICGLLEPEWVGQLVEFLIDQNVDRTNHLDDQDYSDDYDYATPEAFQHLQLARECLAEAVNHQSTAFVTDKLIDRVKNEITSQSDILLNFNAASTLVTWISQYYNSETNILSWFQNVALNNQSQWMRYAVMESIAKCYIKDSNVLTWLQSRALHDESKWVRQAVGQSILEHYPQDDSLTWLQNHALYVKDKDTRFTYIQSISKRYDTDHNVLNWLQSFALLDESRWVRQAVMQHISQYYPTRGNTLNWLQDCTVYSQDEDVRFTAIQSICQYYSTKDGILNWLQDCAFCSQYEDVRQSVVWSIARYYYDTEPTVLNWLQNCAFYSQDDDVRQVALWSIVRYYHNKLDILTWLKHIVFYDMNDFIREIIIRYIAKYYCAEINTLTWLQVCGIHEQSELVRRAAVQSVAKYYHTEPNILIWLQSCTINDRHELVRDAALDSISKHYQTEDSLLTWLKERTMHDPNEFVRYTSLELISKHFIKADGVFELLCQLEDKDTYQENSNHYKYRKTALKALVNHYIDRSETIEILSNISKTDLDEYLREWAQEYLKYMTREQICYALVVVSSNQKN